MSSHPATLPADARLHIEASHSWAKLPIVAFVVGVAGIAGTFALGMGNTKQLYHSWLVALLYFLSLALGSLFFVLIQFLAKAGWSVVVRRIAENLAAPVPIFALLFVPILMGMHDLYHWTHADAVAHDELLQGKSSFLNNGFFIVRAVVYFAVWSFLATWYRRQSVAQDQTGDHAYTRRMTMASAPGVAAFALSITFAAFDWAMSLDPHWYSTMWGVWYFSGAILSAFALITVFTLRLQGAGLLRGVVNGEHYHDLGKLVFAFTVFWAYISFSQYFLIWYANIPEETSYFAHRMGNSWESVGILLMVGHFAVPFLFMMPRTIKRNPATLFLGACWVLLMHYVDIYYAVMPNLHHEGVQFAATDALAFLGVGGVYLGLALMMMRKGALVPVKDPRLPESLAFQNV